MAKTKDKYAQQGYIKVVEGGANTLTFNGISVFSNILTPMGLLLHDVEYNVLETAIAATGDQIIMGLAGDDSLTSILLNDAQVYDYNSLSYWYDGTPAVSAIHRFPVRKTFSHLPGGGKLVPADRLYAYVAGVSLGVAVTVEVRFSFTLIDLSAQEYIELAQALRVLT